MTTPNPQPTAPDAPSDKRTPARRAASELALKLTGFPSMSMHELVLPFIERAIEEQEALRATPPNLNELADAVERVLKSWDCDCNSKDESMIDFYGAMRLLREAHARSGLVSKAQRGGMV